VPPLGDQVAPVDAHALLLRLAGDIIILLAGLVVERATAARLFASPGTEQARR